MSPKLSHAKWVEWMLGGLPQCLLQAQLDPGGQVTDQELSHSLPTSDSILFVVALFISSFSPGGSKCGHQAQF